MQIFLIKRTTMGGSDFLQTAYTNSQTCQIACDERAAEWVSFTPFPIDGEVIQGDRVIVNGVVYYLDKTDANDSIKLRALKKLTEEERAVLGV